MSDELGKNDVLWIIKYLRETGFPNLDAAMKFWEACRAKGMSHDEVAALEQQMRERGRAR